MKVAFVSDEPNYVGGAEMTQAEFRAAAPEGVEVVDGKPGAIPDGCDVYVVHNIVSFRDPLEFQVLDAPIVWFHHDLSPWIEPTVKAYLDERAEHIFCSELQWRRYPSEHDEDDYAVIPPLLLRERFTPPRHVAKHPERRKGACTIGQWRGIGKGGHRVEEWSIEHEPVDVYGTGELIPAGGRCRYRGPLEPDEVARTLWQYETFVFLPTEVEPFGRAVAEAWAAGCKLVVNGNVGAIEWLKHAAKLESAAEDFWKVVTEAADRGLAARR